MVKTMTKAEAGRFRDDAARAAERAQRDVDKARRAGASAARIDHLKRVASRRSYWADQARIIHEVTPG